MKGLLANAVRTDEGSSSSVTPRFVELRPGIAETLGASRHHLLTGRRGTGKSTLLHVLRAQLTESGIPVATIDMEDYSGRAYPDVLIEILIELLEKLSPKLEKHSFLGRVTVNVRRRRMTALLRNLMSEPQSFKHRVDKIITTDRGGGADASFKAKAQGIGGSASAFAKGTRSKSDTASTEFEVAKIERLQTLAPSLKKLIRGMLRFSPNHHALAFIDDFYFVLLEEQPAVLGYLHQVCKGTGVYLKVGGVGTRLRPFVDGNPPVGMQPGHDISRLALDVTLADFVTAKAFLESVVTGILAEFGITPAGLFADEARSRMVLACGGAVARDYIELLDAALDEAVERMRKKGTWNTDATIRVFAVDVQGAVKKHMASKEEDAFTIDAVSDAEALRARWRDICEFTRQTQAVFILVPRTQLETTTWGAEISQLESLRLVHSIGETTPNAKTWAGIKTRVFMVDIGQAANMRLRATIPEFWSKTEEFDKLRRAEWVYTSDWQERKAASPNKKSAKTKPKDAASN